MSGFRTLCLLFERHSKSGPVVNQSTSDHSKTGHARFRIPTVLLFNNFALKGSPKNHLFGAISNALVLSDFFIQLQLSLDILGGVGDANLDTARDSSGNDALQKSVGTAGT